jgi:hypothetical protein
MSFKLNENFLQSLIETILSAGEYNREIKMGVSFLK